MKRQQRKTGYRLEKQRQPRRSRWNGSAQIDHSQHGFREPSVAWRGISIFRVPTNGVLGGVIQVFSEQCAEMGITNSERGIGPEHPPALNQLQIKEIKVRGERFSNVLARVALNDIYQNVYSLQRRLDVGFERIKLFGSPKNPIRSVGITFNEESRNMLIAERDGIRVELEEMSDPYYTSPFN